MFEEGSSNIQYIEIKIMKPINSSYSCHFNIQKDT